MIANKHITKIVAVIMAAAVCLCLCAMVFADDLVTAAGGAGLAMEYESRLFDTSEVIRVNIMMNDADWEEMLQNATAETYYQCDVEINGKVFYRVGIRPKGNTSLSSIAMDPTTDRYSLKLEFDHYVDGQTCFGLDKLILNNNYADTTNMKEALVYDMYQYIGADASLYNYAEISVNDEYWGVYLALEAVEDSFLLRNYGTQDGELYKPDSMDIGGVGGGDGTGGSTGGMNARGKGGFSMGGGGANLNYTDDDLDSYSTIWECEVTNTSKSDHKAVVTALKNISQGTDLETYMDIDNLLKYMAVHVFAVNQDSLSGSMAHNYYLYEYDGKLNILPWDYNLSFGGMGGMGMTGGGSSATSVVNDAVDTPFSGTRFFDTLLENEEYLQRYHYYLQQLTDKYIKDGGLDEFYERTRNQIDKLVETDPTSFYSYEEYLTAAEMLYEIVQLRGESISGQLNGEIPSTDEGQKEDTSALIDASDIDINEMGTMNMGFGGGGMPEGFDPSQFGGGGMPEGFDPSQIGGGDMPEGFDPSQLEGVGMPEGFEPSQFESVGMSEGFDPSQNGGGGMPEGFDPSQNGGEGMPEGFDPSQNGGGMPEGFDPSQFEGESESEGSSTEAAPGNMENGAKLPGRFSGGNVSNINSGNSSEMMKNLIIYAVCFIILIAALVFAGLFRRKSFKRR